MKRSERDGATLGLVCALALGGCGGGPPTGKFPGCASVSGNICTVAGTGIAGDGADELAPLATRLYLPQDMTVGPDGNLFVVDWNNHRIREIDSVRGIMKIVAGAGELSLSVDDPSTGRLNHPTNVAFEPTSDAPGADPNHMVIAAWHNSRVKTMDLANGDLLDVCGNGKRGFSGNGGPASVATLDLPVAVAFDPAGNLLIADQANQMIRIVDRQTGIIETMAGIGHCADAVNPDPCVLNDDGPASAAGFHFPIGQAAEPGGRIALDAAGNIYVADTEDFRLRRIDMPSGIIHTVAGTGVWGYAGDGGPATEAQLGRLSDVAVGPDGSVYIADTDNDCVRVISPAGMISTFAGQCGVEGFAGDNAPARQALLNRPYGVEVSPAGEVYIADTHNQRIRVVFP